MKQIVKIFWLGILLVCNVSYSQPDKLYTSLEDALSVSPDSVYRLDLSKKKYTELPDEIFQFNNLRELYLSKNKLDSLPANFFFKDLRILDLSKNKFETFPTAICNNQSLRNLFMGKNKMKEIPECIGNLHDLIILDIWFNPIDDLPLSMTKLRNLRSLDLSGLNFTKDFQKKWTELLPWVKIEFEAACDCAN
jgi:Leucine-rich repeat (LRR) protein